MLRFICYRLVTALTVLWLVFTAAFLLVRFAPGGPLESADALPPSVRANLEERFGLDRPLREQYVESLRAALRFDFGVSFIHQGQLEVGELLSRAVPISLELGLYATVFALFVGLLAGIVGARRPGGCLDRAVTFLALSGYAVPSLVLAPLLVLLFGERLAWLPVSGWDGVASKVLPTVALGLVFAAALARLSRSSFENALKEDFVVAARARGVSERRILVRHVLPHGIGPVLGFLGPALAQVLTGSIVVERVFAIPGVAEHFIESALARDYPVLMGVVMLYSALLLLLNLVTDLAHAYLDPRVMEPAR